MCTGYPPTVTDQTRGTQMLWNMKNNQFKTMLNKIQKWEGIGFPRVANMEEVRNHQPQHITCLQIAGIRYPHFVMRKDSDL